jgi:uncharacterized membrane protein YhaH (DUF805 family)
VLFNVIFSIVLSFADRALGLVSRDGSTGVLGGIYTLVVLIPSIAVVIRRLHDTGRSGWWMLISLIPCIGAIVLARFYGRGWSGGHQ